MKADIQTIFANRTELVPRCIEAGTRGSLGLVKLRFEFSDEWDGSEKKVVFYPRRGRPIEVPYLSGEIDIPPEVMRYEGEASYVVSGTLISGGEVEAKSISLPGYIKVEFTLNDEGGNSRKVTPDTFDLFMAQSKEYMESVLSAAQESGAFDGVSVESVEQTYTAEGDGESNIITVKLQDGQEFPFAVRNGSKGKDGRGIDRIERTSGDGSAGSVDTYTIYYTDGGTFEFTVVNGGSAGEGGAVYVLEEGESLDDVPEEYDLAYDPYAEDAPEDDDPTIDGGGSAPGTGEPGAGGYSIYQSTEERDDAGSDTISRADATAVILGGRTLRANDFVILSHYLYRVVEISDFYFEGELVANLKGDPGQPGATPHIGGNGNWYIGDTDTGVKAQGEPGAKGDPGEPGQPGEPGADYVLTEADKAEIAQEAASLIDTALLSIIGEVAE